MQNQPKPWAVGDLCPACESELKPVPPPTDAQRAAAANKENPVPLPPTRDHATPDQIAELGSLHRCHACGYQSRVVEAPAAVEGEVADTKPARRRGAAVASTGD